MPIVPDDVSFNKAAIIERSLRRVQEEYAIDPELKSYSHLDALILNVERACQAAIDLAMHITAVEHLGMPQSSADAFSLLMRSGYLSEGIAKQMIGMTGFRNIAIHEYQAIDMGVVHHISRVGWQSPVLYCEELGMRIKP